ncbi:hypothetical protein [Arthrobacter sp. NPDC092385]|uniref:hypothetical protein n=1 Tax=Arthrobacter sp. NPDC092385 TaxID=3363943 RepID=UPI0038133D2A
MSSRVIVPVMCGLAGSIVGMCAALLVVKDWSPDWIEATGTWFGGVGTILTLLWAVRAFRADQVAREEARDAEYTKERATQLAREHAEMKQAQTVSIALQGGGGIGSSPNQLMTTFHVVIKNHSEHGIVVRTVKIDDQLKLKRQVPADFYVPKGETFRDTFEIQEVPARAEELSGRPMTRFTAEMTYQLEGRDWRRSLTGQPERL